MSRAAAAPTPSGLWVRKYGGTSLARVEQIAAVAASAAAWQARGVPQVLVVSAMGRTTDQWLARARQICRAPRGRELDMLVSVGERVTSALMAMAIHEAGGRAMSFTGSQAGIVTTDRHLAAEILTVRPARVEAALAAGEIAVVAGYQGVSEGREVTTLGRGGSDTTAVALAHHLGATRCVLYSDVDGVFSADPRLCGDARRLSHLPWSLMAAMSAAGARVVAPAAAALAARHRVPLTACHSGAEPGEGTQIGGGTALGADAAAFAVVLAPQVVRISGAGRPPAAAAVSMHGARPMLTAGQSLWLDTSGCPDGADDAVAAAAAALGCAARPEAQITWLCACPRAPPPPDPAGAERIWAAPGHLAWAAPRPQAAAAAAWLHARALEVPTPRAVGS